MGSSSKGEPELSIAHRAGQHLVAGTPWTAPAPAARRRARPPAGTTARWCAAAGGSAATGRDLGPGVFRRALQSSVRVAKRDRIALPVATTHRNPRASDEGPPPPNANIAKDACSSARRTHPEPGRCARDEYGHAGRLEPRTEARVSSRSVEALDTDRPSVGRLGSGPVALDADPPHRFQGHSERLAHVPPARAAFAHLLHHTRNPIADPSPVPSPCPGRIRPRLARSRRTSFAIAFSSSEKAQAHTISRQEALGAPSSNRSRFGYQLPTEQSLCMKKHITPTRHETARSVFFSCPPTKSFSRRMACYGRLDGRRCGSGTRLSWSYRPTTPPGR